MFGTLFRGIVGNTIAVFRPHMLLWHALAICLTAALVLSDFDWWFYQTTRTPALHPLVWLAGLGGFTVSVLVPVGLYIYGEVSGNRKLMIVAGSIGQAILIALLVSSFYKLFTGRMQPDFIYSINVEDITKNFQFGVFRNGIFWGWPSSHAAVASATFVTLTRLIRVHIVRWLAFLYVAIVCVGAAIGFHWFSDVIAGIIFGSLIGCIVSKNAFDTMPA